MAVTRVKSQDIKDGEVKSIDIAGGAVTFAKLTVGTNGCLETDGTGADGIRTFVDGTSIVRTAGGLSVQLFPNGGLINSGGGTGLRVRGATLLTAPPGSWLDGDFYFNTLNQLFVCHLAGLETTLHSTFFSGASSSVIVNTAAYTTFTPTKTIPAGAFNLLGRTIRATTIIGGGGVSGVFVLSVQWGGVTIWSSPTMTCTSMGNVWVELLISTVATGAAGQFLVIGKIFNNAIPYTPANQVTTVDLTTNQVLSLGGQFSIANASNAVQLSSWAFELLG